MYTTEPWLKLNNSLHNHINKNKQYVPSLHLHTCHRGDEHHEHTRFNSIHIEYDVTISTLMMQKLNDSDFESSSS